MGKFVIIETPSQEFRFNLMTSNGAVILSSEIFKTLEDCEKSIATVKHIALNDNHYELLMSNNGRYYFNLKSGNGQIIGTSQMYERIQGREKVIDAIKRDAPSASIKVQDGFFFF